MTVAPNSLESYLLAGFAGLVFVAVLGKYVDDRRESDGRASELLAGTGTAAMLAYSSSIISTLGLPGRSSGAMFAIGIVFSLLGGYLLVRERYGD